MPTLLTRVVEKPDYADMTHAEISISQDQAKLILAQIAKIRNEKAANQSLYGVTFWDYSVKFCSGVGDLSDLDQELVESAEMDGKIVVIPDGQETPSYTPNRVDCCEMFIDDEGVHWSAVIKHAEDRVCTAQVPVNTIIEIAQSPGVSPLGSVSVTVYQCKDGAGGDQMSNGYELTLHAPDGSVLDEYAAGGNEHSSTDPGESPLGTVIVWAMKTASEMFSEHFGFPPCGHDIQRDVTEQETEDG